jgi:AMP-binding enzyme
VRFLCAFCTRDRGCSAHPAFPAPSYFSGRRFLYDSGVARRGIAKPHPAATQRKTVSQYGRSILIWHKMKPGSGGARPRDLTEENLPVRHYDWIAHFGRRTPDKIAAVDLASQRRLSYAEFDARISRLATHLRDALKVVRGDRVAVLALNTTDTLEVQFACGRIGAVFLPLNTRLTVPELQFIVGDSSPKVMIHDSDLAEVALTVAKLCNVHPRCCLDPAVPMKPRSHRQSRLSGLRPSRSMTSRPSCTPRAPRASPRARSSPTA